MSGVSAPVVWAIVITMLAAWLWHTLVDHHGHLVLLKVVRPSTVVPPARPGSKWHAASHPRRLMANLALAGAAVLVGLAWELSPYAALVIVAGSGVTFAIVTWMRRAGQAPGKDETREAEGGKSLCRSPGSAGSS